LQNKTRKKQNRLRTVQKTKAERAKKQPYLGNIFGPQRKEKKASVHGVITKQGKRLSSPHRRKKREEQARFGRFTAGDRRGVNPRKKREKTVNKSGRLRITKKQKAEEKDIKTWQATRFRFRG